MVHGLENYNWSRMSVTVGVVLKGRTCLLHDNHMNALQSPNHAKLLGVWHMYFMNDWYKLIQNASRHKLA